MVPCGCRRGCRWCRCGVYFGVWLCVCAHVAWGREHEARPCYDHGIPTSAVVSRPYAVGCVRHGVEALYPLALSRDKVEREQRLAALRTRLDQYRRDIAALPATDRVRCCSCSCSHRPCSSRCDWSRRQCASGGIDCGQDPVEHAIQGHDAQLELLYAEEAVSATLRHMAARSRADAEVCCRHCCFSIGFHDTLSVASPLYTRRWSCQMCLGGIPCGVALC